MVANMASVVEKVHLKDRNKTAFHCTCFSIPFILMNIHFLYRYWTVRHPHLIHLFSRPAFIVFLATTTLLAGALWYLLTLYGPSGEGRSVDILRSVYEQEYGIHVAKGWCVMDFADEVNGTRFAIILFTFDAVMIVSFTNALTLGALTYASIRDAKTISTHHRTLQFKLLIAVTAQTVVPLVFVYIPYFFSVTLPYFNIPAGGIGSVCMLMTACFPAWDAVIIISLMTDYREAILKMTMMRWKNKTAPLDANTAMIVSSVASY
ncbi:hypothetical protein PRIPAC_77429 [Pristionchus pacificus]|uniref:G protein-coupled receptor n=1 Tax=Pristionchus pacificus TaxID=54126 RepID=A0A2A6CL10_PRIPA|nr:hypothetical protein PRIPAC_77429 [Pristionchus pacificus]|eukprot:PDM78778.1 G protein-coupled receptor [Pristionchus pacificus]